MSNNKIGILHVGTMTYKNKEDLEKRLAAMKHEMRKASESSDSILATATAYNIIHIMRQIERLEHAEKTRSGLTRLKTRLRTKIIESLNKREDPTEALKNLLKELG